MNREKKKKKKKNENRNRFKLKRKFCWKYKFYMKKKNSSNGNIKNHRFVLFFSESILYKVFILKRFSIVLCAKGYSWIYRCFSSIHLWFFSLEFKYMKTDFKYIKKSIWLNNFFTYLYWISFQRLNISIIKALMNCKHKTI